MCLLAKPLFFLHQALDRNEPKEVQAVAVQKKNDKDQQEAVYLGAFPEVLRSGNCTKERMGVPVRSGICTSSKLRSYTHTPSLNPLHASLWRQVPHDFCHGRNSSIFLTSRSGASQLQEPVSTPSCRHCSGGWGDISYSCVCNSCVCQMALTPNECTSKHIFRHTPVFRPISAETKRTYSKI